MPKAIPNRIATQIRINKDLLRKTKYISELENRNLNSQIEYFIKKGVEQYESEKGKIVIEFFE